jgi:curli production assembly/transport component CsgG
VTTNLPGIRRGGFFIYSIMKQLATFLTAVLLSVTSGCAYLSKAPEGTKFAADISPRTQKSDELRRLPPPRGPISVAVYSFRDQTGQYKQAPDSSFSTAVSQGGASYLVKALSESGWFTPVEREGLNDLLTERKILKSGESPGQSNGYVLPTLIPANLIIQGAVVGYDFNVTTGGIGFKYLGISASHQYRKDQVTVNLRAVDTNSGKVLHTVSTTKTIYSSLVQPGIYKFVAYKELLEAEIGYTSNEPVQMAIQEAIEAAVIALVVDGIMKKSWVLAHAEDIQNPLIQSVYAKLTNNELTLAMAQKPGPPAGLDPPDFLGTDLDLPLKLPANDRIDGLPDRRIARPEPTSADEAIEAIVQSRNGEPKSPPKGSQESFIDLGRD